MDTPPPKITGIDDNTLDSPPSSTRKSLHQNIIGKLRPLPFQYRWAVWYEKHSESVANYDDRLYLLHEDVADIATFYRIYNNYPWDKIKLRDTVHIFRKGVKPIWEDSENLKGGCWTFRVPKSRSQAFFHEASILCMANELQASVQAGRDLFFFPFFLSVSLVIAIHEALNSNLPRLLEHDHVLGVSMSVRFNSHLISIWNKHGSNSKAIKALEETLIQRLSPDLRPTAERSYFYKRHDEHEGYESAVAAKTASLDKNGDNPLQNG